MISYRIFCEHRWTCWKFKKKGWGDMGMCEMPVDDPASVSGRKPFRDCRSPLCQARQNYGDPEPRVALGRIEELSEMER